MCGVLCWNTIEYTCQSWLTLCWAEWPFLSTIWNNLLYDVINKATVSFLCNRFRSSVAASGGQWHCEHCLNIEWAIGTWYSSLKHFSCWWKALQNLIHYLWIFNVLLYVHLKKWTLKFKMLYMLNHVSYFNKICRICCLNTQI